MRLNREPLRVHERPEVISASVSTLDAGLTPMTTAAAYSGLLVSWHWADHFVSAVLFDPHITFTRGV